MEEKSTGKRLMSEAGKEKGLPLLIAGIVVGLLVIGYLVLCFIASGEKMWPNTTVMGVDVSGLTVSQAEEVLTAAIPQQWVGRSVELEEPNSGFRFSLDAEDLMEPADLAQDLWVALRQGNFLTLGARYLGNLVSGGQENAISSLRYTQAGQKRMDEALSQLSKKLGIDGNETSYTVTDTELVFEKGVTGTTVDGDAVRSGVTAALMGTGPETVTVTLIQAPPAEPDMEAIHREVCTQVADAYLDRESGEIVPAVVGKEFDVEAARISLAATGDGQTCRVPFTLTQPELSTEKLTANLFRDVLGEATTHVTGTSDRKKNVGVAATFVNETIVFPGEEFSFNQTCSPYTVANGYGKATAYVNGLSKDTVAGGICQASSTLYWATLKANLETVERTAHRYEPSYVRGGLDATVYGDYGEEGSLDFRFKNNTKYPVKIEGYMDNQNYLHMIIHGTDETGIHGEPYSTNRVVTRAAQTIYQADASVPQGTTRRDPERTAYNAVSIETYQKLVDANGKEVSTTLLYKTKYYSRDAVIYFNPDDLELWGIDPVTGIRTEPTATPEVPAESGEPGGEGQATPAPGESGEPSTEPTPGGDGDPAVTQPPEASQPPEGGEPSAPVAEPSTPPSDEPLLPPGTIIAP